MNSMLLLVYYAGYKTLLDGCYTDYYLSDIKSLQYEMKCEPYTKCFNGSQRYWNVDKILDKKNTKVNGYLMEPMKIINNPEYTSTWNELFKGIDDNPTSETVRKWLLRLIINPNNKLRQLLRNEQKQILVYPHTIGLQLRMGGNYADTPESYQGVPFHRLPEVIKQIQQVIHNNNWEGKVQVYISSDSSMVVNYLRNYTRDDFPVVESTLFKRGHSNIDIDDLQSVSSGVLSDFYYLSISDHVFVTWPSSLGRLMCFISDGKCDAVLNWKREDKVVPFPQ